MFRVGDKLRLKKDIQGLRTVNHWELPLTEADEQGIARYMQAGFDRFTAENNWKLSNVYRPEIHGAKPEIIKAGKEVWICGF